MTKPYYKEEETFETSYTNRTTATSSADRAAYKFSGIDIETFDPTKDELIEILSSITRAHEVIKIDEESKVYQITLSYIMFPAIFKKGSNQRSDDDMDYAKFIFLNVDSGMNYYKAEAILDETDLSYIMHESISSTKELNRFHILVPTLKKITDKVMYQAYWQYLHQLLNNVSDRKCSSPSQPFFPRVSGWSINKMFRNDLYLNATQLNEYKKVVQSYGADSSPRDLNQNYIDSIQSYRPSLILVDATEAVLRFQRDETDTVGNLVNNYAKDEKTIPDLKKKMTMDLLFSNKDFNNTIEAKDKRQDIQEHIQNTVQEHLSSYYDMNLNSIKSVIIANEGIGKSYSVIKECKDNHVIFAAHTIARVNEIANSFTELDIPAVVCKSNQEIFKEHKLSPKLITNYKDEMNDSSKSTIKYLNETLEDPKQIEEIIEAMQVNNSLLLRKDISVILTTAKLKVLLNRYYKENLSVIVLDEFEASDFYNLTDIPATPKQAHSAQARTFYKDYTFKVYKNRKSLLKLLKYRSSIILTTEKAKVERILYKEPNYEIYDFTQSLQADNVRYVLTHSTSSKEELGESIRDEKIKSVQEYDPDIDIVISNNSELATHSHQAVRGKNNFSDKNTLVVAHYPSAREQYLFYIATKKYYEDKNLDRDEVESDINQVIIQCQVSQSIGRNSGFRNEGAKSTVILPILAPKSEYAFRMKLEFNYISSDIVRLDDIT